MDLLDERRLSPLAHSTIVQARRKWHEKSTAITEADAKEILTTVYQVQGLEAPPVYFFGSPLAAMLAIPHLAAHHKHHSHGLHSHVLFLLKEIMEPLKSRVGVETEWTERRRRLGWELTDALSIPVGEILNPKFLDSFTDRLCGILRGLGGEELVKARLGHGFFGKIDQDAYDWWREIAPIGCWWWPYTRFAVVSAPPAALGQDASQRLHREDGAAAEFSDGLAVWAWHGTIVTERMVLDPESLSESDVQSQASAEIQRVMIERMGAGEWLRKTGAKLIDIDTLTLEGSAPRALMEDKAGNKWLVVTDGSTARVYTIAVSREARTCSEAHRMLAGFPESRLIAEA